MIATSHVIVGGAVGIAVGTITNNPAAALAAGIISHLICDAIPHFDSPIHPQFENGRIDRMIWTRGFYAFAILDSLVAFFLTLFLWNKYFNLQFFSTYAWGALGGYLPDVIDVFPLWSRLFQTLPGFRQFHKLHLSLHLSWFSTFPMARYWPLGIATQVLFIVPCLWYITK